MTGHEYLVQATGDVGCDSGRKRYRVECVTCKEVLHTNTTGPICNMDMHERRVEWQK